MSAASAWNAALIKEASAVKSAFEFRQLATQPSEALDTEYDYKEAHAWSEAYEQAEILTKLEPLGFFTDTNYTANVLYPFYERRHPFERRDLYGNLRDVANARIKAKLAAGVGQASGFDQPGFQGPTSGFGGAQPTPGVGPVTPGVGPAGPNLPPLDPGLFGRLPNGSPAPGPTEEEPSNTAMSLLFLGGAAALAYAAVRYLRK